MNNWIKISRKKYQWYHISTFPILCLFPIFILKCLLLYYKVLTYYPSSPRGTQRKAWDIVIHNNICSSELARMCGMSYISQLGSVKNTHLAARNAILQRILTARSTIKRGSNQLRKFWIASRTDPSATIMKHHRTS